MTNLRPSVRVRKRRLKTALLTTTLITGISSAVYAGLPVVDATAIVKLTEQLNSMKQQLSQLKESTEWLTTLSKQAQDQIDAIGALGKITLPFLNLEKVASQVLSDVQCLTPDLSSLMPDLRLDELKFSSICEGRNVYKEILWYDPDNIGGDDKDQDLTDAEKWRRQKEARQAVDAARESIVKETASTGMAQGDLASTKTAKANEQAAKDLENAAKAAETQQARLAVIAQGAVLQNRQAVQTNQLLGQLLKVQSTMLMQMSVSTADRPGAEEKKDGEK